MRTVRRLAVFAVVVVGWTLVAHGSGSLAAQTAPPQSLDRRVHRTLRRARPPLTDEQRGAALDSAGAMYDSLGGLAPAEQNAQMAQWLGTRPEFEAAGVSPDGCAWGRFTDGRSVVFVNNREPEGDAALPRVPLPPATRFDFSTGSSFVDAGASRTSSDPPSELPGASKVLVADTLGAGYSNLVPYLFRCFTSETGYSVFQPEPTVDTLLDTAFGDLAAFVWSSHGGSSRGRDGSWAYAVGTATAKSLAREIQYQTYLDAGELLYMHASWGCDAGDTSGGCKKLPPEYHYAFTAAWVLAEMAFGPGTLVMIDACTSADTGLRSSFLAKQASLYGGWSDLARHSEPMAVLADRMLGSNRLGSTSSDVGNARIPPKENPKQRPFDWKSVLGWMTAGGYDIGNQEGAFTRLMVSQAPDDTAPVGVLAPSIGFVYASESKGELTLWGLFGSDPGGDATIEVAESPRAVKSWGRDDQNAMDKIVVELPDEGDGASGEVRVEVRDHPSNKRSLSMYEGTFELTHYTAEGLLYEITLDLRFRVDLGDFRRQPGGTPGREPQRIFADMKSKARFGCNGTVTYPDGTVLSWTGSGDLRNAVDGNASANFFLASAWFDPDARKLRLSLSGGARPGMVWLVTDPQGRTNSIPMGLVFGNDTFDGKDDAYPSYIEIELNEDWGIPEGSRTIAGSPGLDSKVNPNFTGTDMVKAKWDAIACQFPPAPDAAR